jgi:hypothetical protein
MEWKKIISVVIYLYFILIFAIHCSFSHSPKLFYILNLASSLNSQQYSIGGTISGLTGSGLVLQNNGGDNLSLSASGSFTFPTMLSNSSVYSVTVLTQPSSQTCSVSNGSGTVVSSSITNITVTCTSSSDSNLSSLVISSGTLSPVFSSSTTSYTVILANSITSITVTPTASSSVASISVNAQSTSSGSVSSSLSISVGSNSISIIVTAQDGTTKTYTITVTRLAASTYRIFVTNGTYTGNLGGPTGADTYCNSDSNKPGDGSTYKAIIIDALNRTACTNTNCSPAGGAVNWVLYASANYVRASDAANLFTTNANSIFVFGTASNSFDSGTQKQYWTGFSNANPWTIGGGDCNNWTSTAGSGRGGNSNATDYTSIRAFSSNCNTSLYLLCAEQ